VPEKVHINAIAYEEDGAWIAQGIEYDIVAYAHDVLQLPDAFARAVVENMGITKHLGRQPLEGVKPAPPRFREMFERATVEVRPLRQRRDTEVAVRVAA
jgi:hypothetical protein